MPMKSPIIAPSFKPRKKPQKKFPYLGALNLATLEAFSPPAKATVHTRIEKKVKVARNSGFLQASFMSRKSSYLNVMTAPKSTMSEKKLVMTT